MTSQDALIGGEWVTVRGVRVWRSTSTSTPLLLVKAKKIKTQDLIACPTCGATLTEQCKTATGNTTRHKDRLLKRRCPCGVPVRPRHRYCDRCGQLEAQRRYKRREIRKPTRERRRAA